MPGTLTAARAAAAAVLAILMGGSAASAQHIHGGYRGYYHHGHGWYRPYGFYPGWYRPYPFIGVGLGVGFYTPYYGSYAYPVAPGYAYPAYPYAAAPVVVGSAPAAGVAPGTMPPGQAAPASGQAPPPDNAGHLQLLVPANSQVTVNGQALSGSGTTREVVTPTLQSGTRYTYKISVRYPDAQGKMVEDTRDVTFQANDWFSVDFTRPAPQPAPAPSAPPPQPLPNQLR